MQINRHQLNFLVLNILSEYEVYGPVKKNGRMTFAKIENPEDLHLFDKKSIIPFKKILFPYHVAIAEIDNTKKIAFIGLNNCDVWALEYLLKEFAHTDLLPERKNILVIGAKCRPEKSCFCELMLPNEPFPWDMYLEPELGDKLKLEANKSQKKILHKSGIKFSPQTERKEAKEQIPLNLSELKTIIEKKGKQEEFWSSLADNCFGCGACTAVCPLCFCVRQEMENDMDSSCRLCLNWDSCFAKRFSEIQNRFDLRPKNADRIYNWYHHKFVRAPKQFDHVLCTGCGRCIDACPANLNIKNILESLLAQEDKENEKKQP